MAPFSICVRSTDKKLEFYPVFIRLSHNQRTVYLTTSFTVTRSKLKGTEIKDHFIIQQLSTQITEYMDKLKRINHPAMTVWEIKKYLLTVSEISFTDFAKQIIKSYSLKGKDINIRPVFPLAPNTVIFMSL